MTDRIGEANSGKHCNNVNFSNNGRDTAVKIKLNGGSNSQPKSSEVCRFYLRGNCAKNEKCRFRHDNETSREPSTSSLTNNNGIVCRYYKKGYCVRKNDCAFLHDRSESSTSVDSSREKSCSICLDVVMEKSREERKFGLLPNCNHCFCFSCIMTWRNSKDFSNQHSYSCPECRVESDYVYPSENWLELGEKKAWIDNYRKMLSAKHCLFFKKGKGRCKYGNKCLFLHALPDGTRCDIGPPRRQLTIPLGLLEDIVDAWPLFDDDYDSIFSFSDVEYDDLEDMLLYY